jgi:hypothetical protein
MTSKYVSLVLMIAICMALVTPARADSLKTQGDEIVIGIVAVTAVLAVVITVLVVHYSKKRSITGCVASAGDAMTITDENDKKIYALSGNTTGVKPGERMKLKGQKMKPTGADKTLVWEATDVSKDFGVCQP